MPDSAEKWIREAFASSFSETFQNFVTKSPQFILPTPLSSSFDAYRNSSTTGIM